MPNAALKATGSYVPDQTIHNEALDQFSNTARLLISQKTGVFCRHHAASSQCTSDLALEAARRCLAQADVAEDRVEAIMLSTSSPDRL
jgi:3-oxoacyl-[acyl-carrier-protein] synthase-3